MNNELICKEYEMLHGEIELQNNLLIFMVTATVTIITIAVKSKNLLLYLFPFFIIIPTMNRIAYYKKAIARISAYMIVFLEPKLNEYHGKHVIFNWTEKIIRKRVIKEKLNWIIMKVQYWVWCAISYTCTSAKRISWETLRILWKWQDRYF